MSDIYNVRFAGSTLGQPVSAASPVDAARKVVRDYISRNHDGICQFTLFVTNKHRQTRRLELEARVSVEVDVRSDFAHKERQ